MSFIIDIIIISVILLFTFLGYKRGLIKVAITLCTFFIAIIVAFAIYKPVSSAIMENTNLNETIENAIVSKILPEGISAEEKIDLEGIKLPKMLLKNTENNIQSIASSFSSTLIETLCFFIIFLVIKLVLKFITVLADIIAKLPILNQFNKLGGTIYGVLEGLLIVFLGFAVISLSAPLLDTSILDNINSSTIGAIFYNNNILLNFIA